MNRVRTERERELVAKAWKLLPTGTRTSVSAPNDDFVVRSARGSRLVDVSGNEYLDYLLGSGPHFLGHAHPAVVEAVREAVTRGSSYLVTPESAVALAEKVVEHVPCAEMVSFHSSGSEATFFAMRLARAYRGRDRILKFEGAFHGMSDYALMSNQWTFERRPYPEASPNSYGIPRSLTPDVLVAPFNDLEATTALIEANLDTLAGVIVEPLQRTLPPAPGFLEGLRAVTAAHGVPLIFDEVVTGFRFGLGGAQARYGVVPDLCALGKTLSAGHPLGIVTGSRSLMELANPMRRAKGLPFSMQTGTFCANPISVAAALAVIGELERPGVYEVTEARGQRLMQGVDRALRDAGHAVQVLGEPTVFQPWFTANPIRDHRTSLSHDLRKGLRFNELLLAEGVLKGHEKFFVSTAHDDADVDRTLDAVRAAAARLHD